jgi:hypothetical protein
MLASDFLTVETFWQTRIYVLFFVLLGVVGSSSSRAQAIQMGAGSHSRREIS